MVIACSGESKAMLVSVETLCGFIYLLSNIFHSSDVIVENDRKSCYKVFSLHLKNFCVFLTRSMFNLTEVTGVSLGETGVYLLPTNINQYFQFPLFCQKASLCILQPYEST